MTKQSAYTQAGVNIEAGQKAVDLMKNAVQATYGPEVLAGVGAFGGLFEVTSFQQLGQPVLVASTDSVGTKTMVAARMNRWDTIGQDLVNHCANDILVQGASPLFFLDYVATPKIEPEQIAVLVTGVAQACQAIGCALLGGETAELPGVYQPGELDLVGSIVGVVDKTKILDGSRIQAGDAIWGLPSTGLHTNGFTLARKVLDDEDWTSQHPDLGTSIGDALLAVHRCYIHAITALERAGLDIRGLAHITGGGVVDNLPRILPAGLGAELQRGTWPEPPIFQLIQEKGAISNDDMFHAFNMGLGMLVLVPAEQVPLAQQTLGDEVFVVGEIIKGEGKVNIR